MAYREADDVVAIVQRFLNDPPSPAIAPPPEHEPTIAELRSGPPDTNGARVRRRELVDLYVEDGVGCVMVDGNVIAVSMMATRILTLLGDGTATLAELAEALVAEFGQPAGDPVEMVEPQVADLVDVGILEIS